LTALSNGALSNDTVSSLAQAVDNTNNLVSSNASFGLSSVKQAAGAISSALDNLNGPLAKQYGGQVSDLLQKALDSAADAQTADENGGSGNYSAAAQSIKNAAELIAAIANLDAKGQNSPSQSSQPGH
jgi:hypothetical protein